MIFKKNGEYHIVWHGLDNPNMGYGSSNLNILKALEGTKVRIRRLGNDGQTAPAIEKYGVGVVYLSVAIAGLEMLPTPYRILFSMFEADRWPQEWVNACNCANQVWVPSEFCRESLTASGCETPVRVVPLGVDPTVYHAKGRKPVSGDSQVFTFGYAGAGQTRKGFDLALRAFREEFAENELVTLAIRSSNVLSSTVPEDSRITLDGGEVGDCAMRDFYQSVDCFVMPARGEGFGLTALESMACGCCAIVTDWGGCRDYLDDDTLRVGIDRLDSADGYHGVKGGHWARPSMASLRYCMRWAYDHREEAAEMGQVAAERVARDWTYEGTARIIEGLLSTVDPGERVEVEPVEVVVWRGDPMKVTTAVGGFVKGQPRILTPEQVARLNPDDDRFSYERRYRRVT